MATSVRSGEVAAAHISTDQWQSFEMRMRRRRVDRLVARASEAFDAGREDAAHEALAEIELLSPLEPRLKELRARLETVSATATPVTISDAAPVPTTAIASPSAPDEITSLVDSAPSAPSSFVPYDLPLVIDDVDEPLPLVIDDVDEPAEPATGAKEHKRSGFGLGVAAAALLACGAMGWFVGPRVLKLLSLDGVVLSEHRATAVPEKENASGETAAVDEPKPSEPLAPIQVAVDEVAARDTNVETPSSKPDTILEPPAQPASNERRVPEPPVHAAAPAPTRPDTTPVPDPAPSTPSSNVPTAPATAAERPTTLPALVETANAPTLPTTSPTTSPTISTTAGNTEPSSPVVPSSVPASVPARENVTVPRDEDRIRAVLDQYASAYSRLDAAAASVIFPGVDRRALARAFDGLESQRVSLGSCDVRPASESAIVDCSGLATWTPKIGGGTRTEARRWQFRLRNESGEWRIVATKVR